jgi:hypothetical protein
MSELNPFQSAEYLEEARTRVTEQFKRKPTFDKYLDLLLSGSQELQDALKTIQQQRSIDTAVGSQLDNIGEIVGLPRGLVAKDFFVFFGNKNGPTDLSITPTHGTYGSLTDESVGAPWYSLNGPLISAREPSDEEYRLMIKAKIIKNRTMARPEDVITAYKFLFGASQVIINDTISGTVQIGIGKVLSTVERGLLFNLTNIGSLLPKTLGVRYIYSEFTTGRVFAFDGFPSANGWGDLSDPALGGFWSNLI